MDSSERWYSVKEVSAMLSVHSSTVIRWIERKVLRAFKFPCPTSKRRRKYMSYRISESELERFIRTGMTA